MWQKCEVLKKESLLAEESSVLSLARMCTLIFHFLIRVMVVYLGQGHAVLSTVGWVKQ